ncbi:MAM and LDL-receptor class A domain-containing protein 1-like [Tubulanus polymorphus]|uniref:MAM and LDL-receptor class A domain-containing protein 1-like n=1 Tax=Tubulanus polymorphus TaxID=672921 RepID=UPI003DA68272
MRRSGRTPSGCTGPSGDHTSGNGMYVYMESSAPVKEGDQMALDAIFHSAFDGCAMNFYYHMSGSSMGRLEVKLNGHVVFERSGDQGNQWNLGSVTIGQGDAAIEFVATRGSSYCSDIAIDDVTFSSDCNSTHGPLHNFLHDFEMDNGIWNSQGKLQWRRYSGFTPSSCTGPSGDHTSGYGIYLYIESSSPAREGDQGILKANIHSASDSCVMNFYYHMYGYTMGKLEVKLNGNVVFDRSSNQGNQWKLGSVTIGQGDAAIEFVATRGSGYCSDIAIDDVTLSEECFST